MSARIARRRRLKGRAGVLLASFLWASSPAHAQDGQWRYAIGGAVVDKRTGVKSEILIGAAKGTRPAHCPSGAYWSRPPADGHQVIADCETGEAFKLEDPPDDATLPAGAKSLSKWWPQQLGPDDKGPKSLEK